MGVEVALDSRAYYLQLDVWDAISLKAQMNALAVQKLHMHLSAQD